MTFSRLSRRLTLVGALVLATAGTVVMAPLANADQAPQAARPGVYLYAALYQHNEVQAVDTATNEVVATIPVGGDPLHLALAPNGKRLYVANAVSDTISVINTRTNTVIDTIATPTDPQAIVVTPNSKRVYVITGSPGEGDVTVVDAHTDTVLTTITGTDANGLIPSPDGRYVYLTDNVDGNNIGVISTRTNTEVRAFYVSALEGVSGALAINSAGTLLYVADAIYQVNVVDPLTGVETTPLEPNRQLGPIALSPDDNTLYYGDEELEGPGALGVISLDGGTNATYSTDYDPASLAPTPDGRTIYLAQSQFNDNPGTTLSALNTSTGATVAGVTLAGAPTQIVLGAIPHT
ncbi:MAG TPA: YncE family protein [Pseudonocardiaceae bacterium]|nr:YncE family protein [Pseudonocardiaceae bacterium]